MASAGGWSLPGLDAVVRHHHFELPLLERPAEHHRGRTIVVGDQDTHEPGS